MYIMKIVLCVCASAVVVISTGLEGFEGMVIFYLSYIASLLSVKDF